MAYDSIRKLMEWWNLQHKYYHLQGRLHGHNCTQITDGNIYIYIYTRDTLYISGNMLVLHILD